MLFRHRSGGTGENHNDTALWSARLEHDGLQRLAETDIQVSSRDETDDKQRVTYTAIGLRLGQQSTDTQHKYTLTIVPRGCTIYSTTNRAPLLHKATYTVEGDTLT